ncbi:2,3-diaminopropionate biosynthesis protein SbnB [Bradyrhizobium liaoningense]
MAPEFRTVSGKVVNDFIQGNRNRIIDVVRDSYLAHDRAITVNPDSHFLRFPDKPSARIIALPAFIGGERARAGIKWISSFPSNRTLGIPRASAVLILNDYETGMPLACLESSQISSARTAASAALAASALAPNTSRAASVAVIGAGLIARQTILYLITNGWSIARVTVFDTDNASAVGFGRQLSIEHGIQTTIASQASAAISQSDLVVFATTAGAPHIEGEIFQDRAPTVLHLSLRDLNPEAILKAQNFTDDVQHVLKADTSLHLTQKMQGNHDFIEGTLVDLVEGRCHPDPTRARIFSPFGLGVLDVALGWEIYQWAKTSGLAPVVDEFFDCIA